MNKKLQNGLTATMTMAMAMGVGIPVSTVLAAPVTTATDAAVATSYSVTTEAHVQGKGWLAAVTVPGDTAIDNVQIAGTVGESRRVEALKITSADLPAGASIEYKAHVQGKGWLDAVTETGNEDIAVAPIGGTVGEARRVEAMKITLKGMPGYSIEYQAHVQGKGWLPAVTAENGTDIETAPIGGTVGESRRVEAVRVEIVKTPATVASVSPITVPATTVGTVATLPATTNVTLSDGTVVAAKITWDAASTAAATYATAGTATVNGTLADYGNKVVTASVTVNPSALAVQSVSAINANEIKVVFNTIVDKTSATNVANYTGTDTVLPSGVTLGTPVLQDDKMSVIIPLASNLSNGASYKVAVSNVLNATNYSPMVAYKGAATLFNDIVAPTVSSAKLVGNTVKLNFNEPISSGATAKVDNGSASSVSNGYTTSTDGTYSQTFTADANAKTVGTHTVTIYNATDLATNVASILTVTYTVTNDTIAPTVTNITAEDSNDILVKFSEALSSTGTVTVDRGGALLNVSTSQAMDVDSTGLTYRLAVTDNAPNTVYATDASSAALTVGVKGYTDNSSLIGSQYTGNVTLSKDITGPVVTSSNLNTAVAGNGTTTADKLVIPFNENVTAGSQSLVTVLVDGVIQTLPVSAVSTSGKNLIINLQAANIATTLQSKVYTVQLASGAVMDAVSNKNIALTTTVDNTSTARVITPTISVSNNKISVAYSTDMATSATTLSNYTLDNKAFPTGTQIAFAGNLQNVLITLPEGTYPTATTSLLAINMNVMSKDGTGIVETSAKKTFTAPVSILDNVKPILSGAKFAVAAATDTTTNKLELDFNEGLASQGATTSGIYNDFKVVVNGAVVTINNNNAVLTNDKKIIVTLSSNINVSQAATVTVVPTGINNTAMDTTDSANNVLTDGTVVSIIGTVLQ